MKPQKQRFRHRPEAGEFGDCHRTAIACLLDLDLEAVPNFGQWYDTGIHGSRFQDECAKYLLSHGLVAVDVAYTCELEHVLHSIGNINPHAYYLLAGESRTGVNHTVIGKGGAIVWDPSLDDAGIVGPTQPDGYFWVTWLTPARFSDLPGQKAAPARPVTQEWVHRTTMMQQSVLLAAIRGPDGQPKYGGGAKMLLRWYRRCVLLSAMDGRVLADPVEPNGGSFTGPALDGVDDMDHWSDRMQVHVNDYLRQVDMLPHHYQLHFMHAVEIVGYKHPDREIRFFWHQLYVRLVHDLHLWPETEEQLDDRLGDSRSGWLKRADPATVE